MPKQRFTGEQMIRILREAEAPGEPICDVCRKYEIAEQTFFRWRRKYGGIEVAEAVRLRQLKRENARLKTLVADRDLGLEIMKELLAKKGTDGGAIALPPDKGSQGEIIPQRLLPFKT